MSKFTNATMVAVQVETAREQVWVQDGITPAVYPAAGIPMLSLLAAQENSELRSVTTPFAGKGLFATDRRDQPLTGASVATALNLNVSYSGTGSNRVVTDITGTTSSTVSSESETSLGPVIVQTRMPTPVTPGDRVSFSGQFGIRRSGSTWARDENDNQTGISVVCTLYGISRTEDEYGTVDQVATPLLEYVSNFQPALGSQQTSHTLPTVSPAVVPAGVSEVHLTIWLRANTTGKPVSAQYMAKKAGVLYIGATWNYFTFSNANPLTLTVLPQVIPSGPPAATWQTRTQEQNRIYRYTYETITDDVVEVKTEKIEADLGVQRIKFASATVDPKVTVGKRVRIIALDPDGVGLTVIAAGRVRSRRIVPGIGRVPQVEIGVHDSHARLGEPCPAAFDTFAKYVPALNRLGIPVSVDGVDVSGPPRPLPPWGGAYPSYADEKLTYLTSLVMARNARKGFLRITREDRLEVLSALPATVALDVSDEPREGHMSYSINAEFGSDTKDLVNAVRVTENLLDSEDFTDRYVGSDDPPAKLDFIAGRTQTAEYRRDASIEALGLSSRTFPVVRGSGAWVDIEAGNFGSNFAAWASAILDRYSVEKTGPRSITLPIVTAAERALVSKLDVLDAIVVRRLGVPYVQRIRRISHTIKPGSWTVELRFDVTGSQVYWLPDTPVPLITLGDTDAGTIFAPSKGLVDGGHPNETVTHLLDGGTL
ncbi:hypothetical protein [Rhodococcoides fascians]|uniref:hypothetical protein n=1 Tax=Rhodococcoides fascians TaxID=1828 RepID=UPI00050C57FE|nr:hypothetical protein [Rhodococcus fascians]